MPVRVWPLKKGDISYTAAYDETQARIWAGETVASYAALDELQQALIMEAYASSRLITAIEADEHAKAVKAAQKKQNRK